MVDQVITRNVSFEREPVNRLPLFLRLSVMFQKSLYIKISFVGESFRMSPFRINHSVYPEQLRGTGSLLGRLSFDFAQDKWKAASFLLT